MTQFKLSMADYNELRERIASEVAKVASLACDGLKVPIRDLDDEVARALVSVAGEYGANFDMQKTKYVFNALNDPHFDRCPLVPHHEYDPYCPRCDVRTQSHDRGPELLGTKLVNGELVKPWPKPTRIIVRPDQIDRHSNAMIAACTEVVLTAHTFQKASIDIASQASRFGFSVLRVDNVAGGYEFHIERDHPK